MIRTLEGLKRAFEGHAPVLHDQAERVEAAVALVVTERADDLALLFIERAAHDSDRWSGDIAFPGGRVEVADGHPLVTAARETEEEVGIPLADTEPIARLDDLVGFRESVRVSGFVWAVADCPEPRPNYEVAQAIWLPFDEIESSERQQTRDFDYRAKTLTMPALRVDDSQRDREAPVALLWGLSYRFLELLMEQCGRPIPGMPWNPEV